MRALTAAISTSKDDVPITAPKQKNLRVKGIIFDSFAFLVKLYAAGGLRRNLCHLLLQRSRVLRYYNIQICEIHKHTHGHVCYTHGQVCYIYSPTQSPPLALVQICRPLDTRHALCRYPRVHKSVHTRCVYGCMRVLYLKAHKNKHPGNFAVPREFLRCFDENPSHRVTTHWENTCRQRQRQRQRQRHAHWHAHIMGNSMRAPCPLASWPILSGSSSDAKARDALFTVSSTGKRASRMCSAGFSLLQVNRTHNGRDTLLYARPHIASLAARPCCRT